MLWVRPVTWELFVSCGVVKGYRLKKTNQPTNTPNTQQQKNSTKKPHQNHHNKTKQKPSKRLPKCIKLQPRTKEKYTWLAENSLFFSNKEISSNVAAHSLGSRDVAGTWLPEKLSTVIKKPLSLFMYRRDNNLSAMLQPTRQCKTRFCKQSLFPCRDRVRLMH